VAFACSFKLLHRARAQSCLTCQCKYWSPSWTVDMRFRSSPPPIRKRNQHFAPRVQASRRAQCPTQCCRPSISRRDITQGELPDTGLEPAQKECFSIRARSLPPKQKTEEGSHTSRFRKAWRLLLQTAWQALVAPQRPLTATAHGKLLVLDNIEPASSPKSSMGKFGDEGS
jgi:hypothetical protein